MAHSDSSSGPRDLLERAHTLTRLNRLVSSSLDQQEVLEKIAHAAAVLTGARVVVFWLAEESSRTLELAASWREPGIGSFPLHRLTFEEGGGIGWVAANGRSLRVANVFDDPRFVARDWWRAHALRSFLAFPIVHDGALLAVLGLNGSLPFEHDPEDESLLESFLAQASVATRNARAYTRERAQRERIEILGEVTRDLLTDLDSSHVLRRIVDGLAHSFSANVGLFLVEGDDLLVERVTSAGSTAPVVPLRLGEGLSGECALLRAGVLVNDYPTWPRANPLFVSAGIRHVMAQPLVVGAKVLGVLTLSRSGTSPPPFSHDDLATLGRFAEPTALVLRNVSLFEDAERGRREAEEMARVARLLTETLDPAMVGARIVESVLRMFPDCISFGVTVPDADGAQTVLASGGRLAPHFPPGQKLERLGLADRVTRERRILAIADLGADASHAAPEIAARYRAMMALGVRAAVGIPLTARDRVVGVLRLSFGEVRVLTAAEVVLAQAFADQAALALENARLYEDAERRRREAVQLVDERQGAQTALRESEKLYRLLAENATDVISVFDLDLRLTYVSPSVVRLRGYTPEEAIAQSLDERLTPASRDLVGRAVEEGLAGEREGMASAPFRLLELEQRCKGGGTVWTEVTVSALRDDGGQRVGYLSVARDMSERKRAETTLRAREEELRQAQKMEAVGQLAGGIAHDFNNLLTIILGRCAILLEDRPHNDPARSALELIEQTADRAASLTRQLLAFGGKQMLQPRSIDLDVVVARLLAMLRRLIGEDIEIEVERSAPAWVEADPGQIEQVILNLVVNARDAMPQGGRVTLGVSAVDVPDNRTPGGSAKAGSWVRLSVADNGIGMDAATCARIFEPFFTTKPVGKGTGMGLATVFGIVKQSGGDITVSSEPGRGTRFEIFLPRIGAPAARAGLPAPSSAQAERSAAAARGTETILVLEDEPELRELIQEALKLRGYAVLSASRPSAAQQIMDRYSGTISLLVTDIVMPEISGPQFVQRLRRQHPDLKVVYISGYAEQPGGLLDAGAPFLQKPFTMSALLHAIRELLDAGRS